MVSVDTSIGKTFDKRIEKGLRKMLVQAARELPPDKHSDYDTKPHGVN